jgi:ferrous iron transport protein B
VTIAAAPAVEAFRIAVAGNPNTGKSTLFNALTGLSQQTGNYPGVTVERRQGRCRAPGVDLLLVDLPGTYSLAAASLDEKVVVDALLGRLDGRPAPQAVLCVVDACNLRRNLYLVSQIAETGLPIVIALNMVDEATAKGLRIDVPLLSARLGVPVIPTVASRREGIQDLEAALARTVGHPGRFSPVPWPAGVTAPAFEFFQGEPAEVAKAGVDGVAGEATLRYAHLEALTKGVVTAAGDVALARPYAADRILTHRLWGLLIFAAIMFGIFASIYWAAKPLMDGIDVLTTALSGRVSAWLEGSPMLQSLVADGVIAGVGGVVIFLPQILILFLFVAVLEDTGYMARAAFLMDKVFAWTGLNGKSFVPMLSSFACAVPGLMATRTIEDPKARLSTILISPLMSCSARLPVYTLMIGAFIAPRYGALLAGATMFGMYALGIVLALVIAALINRFLLKLNAIPFVLEMPPYRTPTARNVLRRMYVSGREFVVRAGTVIFAFSIVIWAMTYFPRPDALRAEVVSKLPAGLAAEDVDRAVNSAYLEQSLMGRIGKTVQPVFAPAGFDWKITVAVLAAFPAREVVVSTLGIIYAVESDDDDALLREKLAAAAWPDGRAVFTPAVALAVMVFFALCLQCGSTVAVMAREAGWRWAGFAFAYMTGLAWLGAVATYQIGRMWT